MRCLFEGDQETEAQQAIVDAWIVATDCAGIDEILVEELAVVIRGKRNHYETVSGMALRHDDLAGELTAALANMRKPRGQEDVAELIGAQPVA